MIRLLLLGSLSLERNGQPLEGVLSQPKRVALLSYLALARPRGLQRRDTLLPLFWPERDATHARHALRQALYVLRRGLGEDVFRCRGDEEVGLEPGALWCDALAFARAVEDDDPARGVSLYRGELLHGFFVAGAPQYERWLAQERVRFREMAAATAWRMAARAEAEGNVPGAVHHAREASRLSPCDEPAVRRLLSLLARAGDRAGAIRTYREFERELWREFEVGPSPETESLLHALKRREPESSPAS